jgi:hypothetical protein
MDADQAGLRVAQPFGHDVSTFGGGFVNGGNQFISGAAPVAGADLVVVDTLSTTTLTFRVNKLASAPLVYAAGVPASNAASKIGLGSGWTNTATQNQRIVTGRIYAALFINKVLTAQEIADLENWLYAKAGLL